MNIFLSIVSGAAVGYATNSLAVSMLFKKIFGRWGGVIERYYNEFIAGMSQLVESDLVNHNTLKDELSGEAFRAAAAEMCRTVIAEKLPAHFGSVRLCDIPGMDESAASLEKRLKGVEAAYLGEISAIFEDTALTVLCSPAHIDHIFDNVCRILLTRRREIGGDSARAAAALVKERQLSDFLEQEESEKIAHNAKNLVEAVPFNKIKD
ncbi:MAG: DUF445 family protein, partial [Spirochaetaceae bacterium]|nr:DUF445 family protein [Spirochaetaceae bacterium]